MNDAERLEAVRGCKFVDDVVENVPYVMDDAYLQKVRMPCALPSRPSLVGSEPSHF